MREKQRLTLHSARVPQSRNQPMQTKNAKRAHVNV